MEGISYGKLFTKVLKGLKEQTVKQLELRNLRNYSPPCNRMDKERRT
jgi:hypothetical protein